MKLSTRVALSGLAGLCASVLAVGCGGGGNHGGFIPPQTNPPPSNPTPQPPPGGGNGGGSAPTSAGGGGVAPSPSSAVTSIALPTGFEEPRGIAAQRNGDTIFITARDANTKNAVILAISKSTGSSSVLVTGSPLGTAASMTNPVALALSPDEKTLYATDFSSGFSDATAGAILSVSTSGGTVKVLSAGVIDAPTGVVVSPDGATLFVTGIDPSDGRGAVYSVPASGGAATQIAKGGLLTCPTGIGIGDSETLFVADAGQRLARPQLLSVSLGGGTTALVGTIDDRTEIQSGVVVRDNTVRVAARRGNAPRIVTISQSSGSEIGSLEGPPLVAPNGLSRDANNIFIADSDAAGPGLILRSN